MIAVPNTDYAYADRMLLKWVIVMALAAALTLAVWSRAGGAEPRLGDEPKPLPPQAAKLAKPLPLEGTPRLEVQPESAVPLPEALWPQPLKGSLAAQVRQIFVLHRNRQWQDAVAGWNQLGLWVPSQEAWRQIALTQAELASRHVDRAARHLDIAQRLAPTNPLVHYYTGLLRLEQARHAREWREDFGPRATQWVSFAEPVAPNTRSMYLLAAESAFSRALELMANVDPQEPLVNPELLSVGESSPTVEELLVSLDADAFAAKSHHYLGRLLLQRSLPEESEKHLDAAHLEGLSLGSSYSDLARVYRRDHRSSDAFRAELKQLQQGAGVVRPAQRAWQDFLRALIRDE